MSNATKKSATRTRSRYTKLNLAEISAVDVPAQEGAIAVSIMKRGADEAAERKVATEKCGSFGDFVKAAMTTADKGHVHLLDVARKVGETNYAKSTPSSPNDYSSGHTHSYIVTKDGEVVIGEADGHTHTVAVQVSKSDDTQNVEQQNTSKETETMSATAQAPATKPEERISALENELRVAKALAEMTDAQKTHYASLEAPAKVAFEKMDGDARQVAVTKAASSRRVVYKALDGSEYTDADDPRVVSAMKRADDNERKFLKAEEARTTEVYKRRARTEIGHLPGKIETHVSLLKAIDGIADETERAAVLEVVKSNDAGVGRAFETIGEVEGEDVGDGGEVDPEQQLQVLAQKRATEKKISVSKAYLEVLDTEEGRELYAQIPTRVDPRNASIEDGE